MPKKTDSKPKTTPKKVTPKAAAKAAPKAPVKKVASKAAPDKAAAKPAEKKHGHTAAPKGPAPEIKKVEKHALVEDKMTSKERLRRVLLVKRQEIVRETKAEIKKYISGENRQLVETVMDEGDLSVVDLSEDISLKQLSTHREVLIKLDIALRKLEEDTYGICEECGDEISEPRLKVLPFAIYCRDCQERKELFEKLEKEER